MKLFIKLSQLIIMLTVILGISGCFNSADKQNVIQIRQAKNTIAPVESVGYSSMTQYASYPVPQQRLMAIRAAKLDAYRNIAEELYGVKIKGNTTVKDLVIESDSYRVYVNGLLKGVHIQTVTPKGNGVYEAEAILNIDNYIANCLYYPHHACVSSFSSGGNSMTNQTSPSVQYITN